MSGVMIQTACDASPWPLRSMLFVPGHMPERVRKTPRFSPDAVVVDLEDSVPPKEKPRARALVAENIALLRAEGIPVVVRVNGMTEGAREDLAACVVPGLTTVMLPKADNPDEIAELHDLLSYREGLASIPHGQISILPIPETAKGLRSAHQLAAASARVCGLLTAVGGPIAGDIARAAGIRPTVAGDEQTYLQSKIVLDSRAAGARYPIAGIIGTPLNDLKMVEDLVRRAKAFGFSGAALIHPDHVKIANDVFRATPDEVAYFEGMIAAFEEAERSGKGAISYRGAMVDYAMLPTAREIVDEARRHSSKAE
jgi:citrate lyase subunit beta / citryl-CoA lyase